MRELQGEGMEMQGIAKIISPSYGLERFWMKADLPQKLLKKSCDKAQSCRPLQNAACANFAKEKSKALVVERSDG